MFDFRVVALFLSFPCCFGSQNLSHDVPGPPGIDFAETNAQIGCLASFFLNLSPEFGFGGPDFGFKVQDFYFVGSGRQADWLVG